MESLFYFLRRVTASNVAAVCNPAYSKASSVRQHQGGSDPKQGGEQDALARFRSYPRYRGSEDRRQRRCRLWRMGRIRDHRRAGMCQRLVLAQQVIPSNSLTQKC